MRNLLAAVLLIGLMLAGTTGCIAVAAGAAGVAGYAYIAGNAEGVVDAAPERVEASALAVFREMDMEVSDTKRDEQGNEIVLRARGPENPARVIIRREGDASRLFVRVGATGNKEYSTTVYERIVARL